MPNKAMHYFVYGNTGRVLSANCRKYQGIENMYNPGAAETGKQVLEPHRR
jgi:hypothetical protein